MKALFLIADRTSAASRLRAVQYAELLRRDGVAVRLLPTKPSKYLQSPAWLPRRSWCRVAYGLFGMTAVIVQRVIHILLFVPRADVVFLQKDLLFRSRFVFLERLIFAIAQARRARVVFDIDDAIYLGTSIRRIPQMATKIRFLVRSSTIVLAGSQTIAADLAHQNADVRVWPTRIRPGIRPARSYERRSAKILHLVWTGTATNARHLEQLSDALTQLSATIPVQLEVITRLADLPPRFLPHLNLRLTEWADGGEAAAFDRADIALAPLADDPWTRAKSGGRILSYFASAMPVVASPIGAQAQMVGGQRAGLLARSAEEWTDCLLALAADESLRCRLGEAGRLAVEGGLSAESSYPEWRQLVLGTGSIPSGGRGTGANSAASS